GDNLCIVGILAVDQPRGELGAAGAEEHLVPSFRDDHLHLARFAFEHPGELCQGPCWDDEACLQVGCAGRGELADGQAVTSVAASVRFPPCTWPSTPVRTGRASSVDAA